MVTIKQISNENIIISWEQHIFWQYGNILQVQFRYETVSCNIHALVCFLLLIIVHSSQTCITQTLSHYELWRKSVIICASDSLAAGYRSLSKPQQKHHRVLMAQHICILSCKILQAKNSNISLQMNIPLNLWSKIINVQLRIWNKLSTTIYIQQIKLLYLHYNHSYTDTHTKTYIRQIQQVNTI